MMGSGASRASRRAEHMSEGHATGECPRMPIDSHHLVDPELLPLLQFFPPGNFDDARIAEIRGTVIPIEIPEPLLGVATREALSVPGRAGDPDVPILIYRPAGATGPLPTIFHIHGGGYVMGSA